MLYTAQQWKDLYPNRHMLFQKFSFLSQHNIAPDQLHVNFLGTTKALLGTVLWLLVYRLIGGPAKQAVAQIWEVMLTCYRDAGCAV